MQGVQRMTYPRPVIGAWVDTDDVTRMVSSFSPNSKDVRTTRMRLFHSNLILPKDRGFYHGWNIPKSLIIIRLFNLMVNQTQAWPQQK